MIDDRTRRIASQHARTLKLMGVDFVPVRLELTDRGALVDASPNAGDPGPDATVTAARPAPGAQTDTPPEVPADARPEPGIFADDAATRRERDPEASQRLLNELRERYERDAPHKAFVTEFQNIVFGEGNPTADLMFVGEAPGAEEDRTGRPFVGKAGQLLDRMIAAMGLRRQDVYIGNVLKTRPPGNATPMAEEIRLCAPYLFEQIRIISPRVIVTLGLPATRSILGTNEAMGRLRGRWRTFTTDDGLEIPVMPTYHPAFLLRSYTRENREKVWSDLRKVMERLGLTGDGDEP